MGKITLMPETTKYPITLMGQRAGVCWGADTSSQAKNYARGLDCLESNHGRVQEFVNVEFYAEGYSARMIREWYTHIGGMPTRLQASTRYINYSNFGYVTPKSIESNEQAKEVYEAVMHCISYGCTKLKELGIPNEDASMALPLGMTTSIVDKRNMRNLIDMSRQRMCTRAYWEYREMFRDLCKELSNLSDEWAYIVDNYMMPKCEVLGYCPETRKSCGRKPQKKDNAQN